MAKVRIDRLFSYRGTEFRPGVYELLDDPVGFVQRWVVAFGNGVVLGDDDDSDAQDDPRTIPTPPPPKAEVRASRPVQPDPPDPPLNVTTSDNLFAKPEIDGSGGPPPPTEDANVPGGSVVGNTGDDAGDEENKNDGGAPRPKMGRSKGKN